MHNRVKRQGTLQGMGATGQRASMLRHAGALVLAALVVNVSPASAAQQPASQVTFTAYRDHRGLVIQDGGDWPSGSTGQGAVNAYWERGAIRLALTPVDVSGFSSDVFERIDGNRTTAVLGPPAETNLDVRGVYRAELRDATGASVGWLRVSVSPFDVAPRVYDGNVPATITPQVISAALARLDAELDGIEAHAQNVYLGN
jgi:hypothetical protein